MGRMVFLLNEGYLNDIDVCQQSVWVTGNPFGRRAVLHWRTRL
jgi:hypothetical protein